VEPFPFPEQLRWQLERSPFSEDFTVEPESDPPFTVRGIFDESVLTGDERKTTRPVPRILLYEAPEYISGKTKVIARGKVYHAQKHEIDANIGVVLYLI
jgi:hypothetical protein